MVSLYIFETTGRRSFIVGPSSPPATEKSRGKRVHFCIFWAFEVARELTESTADCKK